MFGCPGVNIRSVFENHADAHVNDRIRISFMLTIFDCDGVLVDSENLAARIFSEQLALRNILLTPLECKTRYKGLTLVDCLGHVEREFSCSLRADFLEQLKRATQEGFDAALKPIEGIETVLDWLQLSRRPVCVASNGGREKIEHSLVITGLHRYFKHLFSADAVAKGKPAPDLFLLAAASLGFAPQDCVVIEDSLTGVRAAKAAEMSVLVYSDSAEFSADVVQFTRMDQLPCLLQSIWQRSQTK
jgi:HAD superfamily hydrolase (TIGR01509 family)